MIPDESTSLNATLVVTVIGPDRPGLVQAVAACVADLGGNWLESRMCRLGGQFAGILRVEVTAERQQVLATALRALEAEGLRVIVHPEAPTAAPATAGGTLNEVSVIGQDRPGILRSVATIFARHRVNVEDLTSEIISTPMGGGTLFQARAIVRVPAGASLAAVRADLEQIAADLMVDVSVQPR